MKPLDLTKRPPRSPREQLAGLFFLPRTVDKMRAALPGGNTGAYNDGCVGASSAVLEVVGIKPEDLQAVVARADSEDEIAAWVRQNADTARFDEANRVALGRSVKDIEPERLARFAANYPDYKDVSSGLLADILEADDAAMFSKEQERT